MNTPVFQAGEFSLPLDRTYVMGILNVTPDSFSDGGKYLDPTAALERALASRFYGLTLIDRTRLPRDLWQRRGESSLTGLFLEEMWQLCQTDPENPAYQLAARFGLAALENGEDAAL